MVLIVDGKLTLIDKVLYIPNGNGFTQCAVNKYAVHDCKL